MPALLTSTSIRPKVATILAIAASTCASSATSTPKPMASVP
jgi:hypothetical protein